MSKNIFPAPPIPLARPELHGCYNSEDGPISSWSGVTVEAEATLSRYPNESLVEAEARGNGDGTLELDIRFRRAGLTEADTSDREGAWDASVTIRVDELALLHHALGSLVERATLVGLVPPIAEVEERSKAALAAAHAAYVSSEKARRQRTA